MDVVTRLSVNSNIAVFGNLKLGDEVICNARMRFVRTPREGWLVASLVRAATIFKFYI